MSPQATTLAKDLWIWCLERNIFLTAQHLPWIENIIADSESRVMRDRSDWKLNPIRRIQDSLGPLEVDLFASRLTAQLPRYFSWRPDPQTEATDALLQGWRHLRCYANPPWNLVGRVLAKAREQEATLVLVAPIWPAQTWYPLLLSLLVNVPLRIKPHEDLILETREGSMPDLVPHLAVWPISGNTILAKRFQKKLRSCSSPPGEASQQNLVTPCVGHGSGGVVDGVVIPFQDLYKM